MRFEHIRSLLERSSNPISSIALASKQASNPRTPLAPETSSQINASQSLSQEPSPSHELEHPRQYAYPDPDEDLKITSSIGKSLTILVTYQVHLGLLRTVIDGRMDSKIGGSTRNPTVRQYHQKPTGSKNGWKSLPTIVNQSFAPKRPSLQSSRMAYYGKADDVLANGSDRPLSPSCAEHGSKNA